MSLILIVCVFVIVGILSLSVWLEGYWVFTSMFFAM